MSYRAIGSGGGESEVVGQAPNLVAASDFGASDVPMTQASYNSLAALGVQVGEGTDRGWAPVIFARDGVIEPFC